MTPNQLVTLSSQELDLLIILVDNQNNLVKKIGSVNLEEVKIKLSLIKVLDPMEESDSNSSESQESRKTVHIKFTYNNRVPAIRKIRDLTGLSLGAAKDLIDAVVYERSSGLPVHEARGTVRLTGVTSLSLRLSRNHPGIEVEVVN